MQDSFRVLLHCRVVETDAMTSMINTNNLEILCVSMS